MKKLRMKVIFLGVLGLLATIALGISIMDVVKVVGVGAAVDKFGPEINKEFNKLTKHKDTVIETTKVVPIISIGINGGSSAIGAAQVTGPQDKVAKVKAVAQPEAKVFGELRIRALIPVESKNVIQNIKKVEGVGVTGIVDLKL
jgi:hypothetical protein